MNRNAGLTPGKPGARPRPYRRCIVAKKFPSNPANPHRLCWGCDKYCPAHSMVCGNGSDRTQHPVELLGADWEQWGQEALVTPATAPAAASSNS